MEAMQWGASGPPKPPVVHAKVGCDAKVGCNANVCVGHVVHCRAPLPTLRPPHLPWLARSCCRWRRRWRRRSCKTQSGKGRRGKESPLRAAAAAAAPARRTKEGPPAPQFTYCRGSGRSCRCPAGRTGRKWRSAGAGRRRDPSPSSSPPCTIRRAGRPARKGSPAEAAAAAAAAPGRRSPPSAKLPRGLPADGIIHAKSGGAHWLPGRQATPLLPGLGCIGGSTDTPPKKKRAGKRGSLGSPAPAPGRWGIIFLPWPWTARAGSFLLPPPHRA